jgi:poly-gamma-glutamate synthesis protein (capsule biosynthesis protein)
MLSSCTEGFSMPEPLFDPDGFFKSFNKHHDPTGSILLLACGDTGPVRKLEQIVREKGSHHVLSNMLKTMANADAIFANLECTFSLRGKPSDKVPVFRLSPESFSIIRDSKINIVSLANNHVSDYGPEAFKDTLELLDVNRIAHVGGGLTREESIKPHIMEIKGIRLGFLGFREKESFFSRQAGIYTAEIDDRIYQCIKRLRPLVDWVVLSLHFGWEYQSYPSPRDVRMCRKFIDAGADIILGHHPHYPQGLEKYKEGIIAYSLGNFLWDQNFVGHTSSSFLLQLELSKTRIISARVLPCSLNAHYQLELSTDPEPIHDLDLWSRTLLDGNSLRKQWYFSSRNKIIEILRIVFRSFSRTSGKKNIRRMFGYSLSPRFVYTFRCFSCFLLTGQAVYYELKKRFPAPGISS